MEQPFQFCEPGNFSAANKELDTRMTGGQMMEFAFNIKAGPEGKPDTIQNIGRGWEINNKYRRTIAGTSNGDALPLSVQQ